MEVSDYVISTLDEFFTMAGFEIYSEEGEEVHLKVKSTNKLIKVRRDLFMKYVTPESSVIEEEDIEDMEDEQYNIMVKTASAGLKEITNARRKASSKEIKDFEQASLIKSDVSHVEKASEVQGANINSSLSNSPTKNNKKDEEEKEVDNFANVFDGLENMSGASTLFDGIDSDDDDAPPMLPGMKNKVGNNPNNTNTKEKSSDDEERGQDQSQQKAAKATPEPGNSSRDSKNRSSDRDLFVTKTLSQIPKNSSKDEDFDFIEKRMTMKVTNPEKFFDPMIIIAQLREELRLKNAELQRINLKMNTFKEDANQSVLNQTFNEMNNSSSYHLAFLFASPLVRKLNSNIEMIMQLDYQNEIIGIEKHLSGVKHLINYKVDVATQSNFRSVIVDAPFALHFTGHGIPNDKKALGPAHMQFKDKGNILLLEDECGMADYLFETDLKKLVDMTKANKEFSFHYEVVFLSSCYSELTSEIFLNSGARHVICIQKDKTISDKASLRFSKVFYETLFVKKYSVCRAFKIAKDDIRTLINTTEANKFLILVNEHLKGGKNHK